MHSHTGGGHLDTISPWGPCYVNIVIIAQALLRQVGEMGLPHQQKGSFSRGDAILCLRMRLHHHNGPAFIDCAFKHSIPAASPPLPLYPSTPFLCPSDIFLFQQKKENNQKTNGGGLGKPVQRPLLPYPRKGVHTLGSLTMHQPSPSSWSTPLAHVLAHVC